jgi:HK97 family phage portal protein
MGLFGRQQRDFYGITGAEDLIPGRMTGGFRSAGAVTVTDDRAMRHSVVWACLDIRSGLISTFPVDQYRDVLGLKTEWPYKPTILTDPGGTAVDIIDFMAMTQTDLDRAGNTVGLIVERSAAKNKYHPKGLPNRIELQAASTCAYLRRPGQPDRWRIDGKYYDLDDVYHERANLVAGSPVGLPTVVYAALTLGESLSMQEFGLSWFESGGVPKARLRNTAKRLTGPDVDKAKQWYRDVVTNGDLFVTGADWEYDLIQANTAGMEFIEGRKLAGADICRFFKTPADLVDVQASSGGSITYANITQRNLQFLIHKLGPTVIRREKALTKLLPTPRYVKLNTNALLRMDPETQQQVVASQIKWRTTTNTEARALQDKRPLTDAERTEFEELYGAPKAPGGDLGETDAEPTESEPAPAGASA